MAGRLQNKVAFITGAASGIGAATAALFAQEGAKVAVADVLEDQGHQTVDKIKQDGGTAIFIKCNVSQADQVKAALETTEKTFGRLDIIYNNAGIEGVQAPIPDFNEADFDRVLAINAKGVFLGLKFGIPLLLKYGGGSIINTASVSGLIGNPNMIAYNASKGAVVQMTRVAALEWSAKGIRVNAIAPGVIDTPMVRRFLSAGPEAKAAFEAMEPIGRFGQPEEIAKAVLFLASDDASFVTGSIYTVDGGYTAQ